MSPRVRKQTSRYEATGHPNINRDRRSGIYYFRGAVTTDDFQSVFVDRSLKTTQLGTAIERAKRIRVKIAQGDQPIRKRHTFREAFELVLKVQSPKAKGTSDQTGAIIEGHLMPWFDQHCKYLDDFVKNYEGVWAEYRLTGAGRKMPTYLEDQEGDSDRVLVKKARRREAWHADPKNQAPRKLEHDRRFLNMALKRAYRAGWIKKEFKQRDFELNEVSDDIGQYVEDADLIRLIEASKPYPKLFLQVLLGSHLGLRISEILHLRKEEVDLKRRVIDLDPKRLKTRRRREVPIPIMDEVYPYLRQAYQSAKGDFIFPAERRVYEGGSEAVVTVDLTKPQDDNRWFWDKVRAATGLQVRFHDLRHTAITNALVARSEER